MLELNNTGLIVVDIQGKLARLVHESNLLISNCEKLVKGAKTLNLPIIVLEQNPEKLGSTVTELSCHLDEYPPITKFSFDACQATEFINKINNTKIENWLICGIEAHICVYQTATSLIKAGLNVQLVIDCIASRSLTNKNLAIEKLKNCGSEMTSLEMCLYELVKNCRAKEFKEILNIIK